MSKGFNIKVHEIEFNTQEVLINPNIFPDLKIGDIINIHQPHFATKDSLYIKITSIEFIKGIMEISLQKNIANIFKIDTTKPVFIEKITDFQPLGHLEFTFRDQFVSGGQMWLFKEKLNNETCYMKKNFTHCGVTASVTKMMRDGIEVKSGLISSNTKITFRSRSGYVYWLIQMSKEMWEYSNNGELNFEKALTFISALYQRWKNLEVKHKLTIVFFSRFYKFESDKKDIDGFFALKGVQYFDFVKCLQVDIENTSLENIIILLKKEFIKYPKQINDSLKEKMENSDASEGNILETMNLVFDEFDKQHINRNLFKTGFFIHIISAGSGVITINHPDIAHITQYRIGSNEMTVDYICLADPPLHGVPILRYKEKEKDYFIYAYWLDLVFYNNEKSVKPFIPSSKISFDQNDNQKNFYYKVFNLGNDPEDYIQSPFEKNERKESKIKKIFSNDDLETPRKSEEKERSTSIEITESQSFSPKPKQSFERDRGSTDINILMHCNPFDLTEFENQTSSLRKRIGYTKQWGHLYPPNTIKKESIQKGLFLSNWKTLIEPACLPVTTDYWPSFQEL